MPESWWQEVRPAFVALALCLLMGTAGAQDAYKKHALILGGGGEPASKEDTIFDEALKKATKSLTDANYYREYYFDGGHKKTEALLAQLTDNKGKSFTRANVDAAIVRVREMVESGEIKAGDQMLISVDSHGAPHANKRTKSHTVATSDSSVSLDLLGILRDYLKSKGVRVAIIDGSCFSGNSLALADSDTCVITGTQAEMVGFTTFNHSFWDKFKAGKTLEEVYLNARMDKANAMPQISSPAGRKTAETIRPLQTALWYHPQEFQHLSNCASCYEQFKDPTGIEKIISNYENITKSLGDDSQALLNRFRKAVGEYRAVALEMQNYLDELHGPNSKIEKPIFVTGTRYVYTWKELAVFDEESVRKDWGTEHAELLNAIVAAKTQLFNSEIGFASFVGTMREYKRLVGDKTEQLRRLSAKVAEAEGELYRKLYQQNRKETEGGPNPCANFYI